MAPGHLQVTRPTDGEPTSAETFALIWEALADLFGTATTAVLMRRAARRATRTCAELAELEISVGGGDDGYTLPRSWQTGGETPPALRALIGELVVLLHELTGDIAVRRLERIPGLSGRGLLTRGEERPS